MQKGVRLLGHAIHPMLVGFPVGLLSMVPIFYIAALVTRAPLFAQVSFWMATCGLAGGLLAAIFGLLDWLSIPAGTRAHRVGIVHLTLNLMMVGCFGAVWILALIHGPSVATPGELVVSLLGLGILLVAAWFGGELVEQHGMGVRAEAHLNAPSSLDADRLERRQPLVTPPSGGEPQPT
jgi:uncharacterized membrane protein